MFVKFVILGLLLVQKSQQYRCKNGNGIDDRFVCDRWNNCGDWSDEYDPETGKCPECPAGLITCIGTGRCIREHQLCNKENDCENFYDEREEICGSCQSGEAQCPGNDETHIPRPCLRPEHFCDFEGIWDCPDGFDEANCTFSADVQSQQA